MIDYVLDEVSICAGTSLLEEQGEKVGREGNGLSI